MPTSSPQRLQFCPTISMEIRKYGVDRRVSGGIYAPAAKASGTSIPGLIAWDTLHLARLAIPHDSAVIPSLSAGENGV